MFGSVRHVFTSRWKAISWALGVLLTAYCSVPSPDPAPGSKAALAARHVNPWEKGYHPGAATPQDDHMSFKEIMEKAKEAEQGGNQDDHVNPWAKKPDPKQS